MEAALIIGNKISQLILYQKDFETTVNSIRAQRGLEQITIDYKLPRKNLKGQRKIDTFLNIKKNTNELLKDKNLPANFIENILNILKTAIFEMIVKGLK